MSNRKRKCKQCDTFVIAETGVKVPAGFFCSMPHVMGWLSEKRERDREKLISKAKRETKAKEKIARAKHKDDKERVKRRCDWLDQLQTLVNQYVIHVRDVGKPCCTCGTTKPTIKYDAGHCFTRAARSDIRFELTNIHKQCSVNCNQYGSGMRKEYKEFIVATYGQEHWEWLEEVKPNLKEQFPDYHAIKKEIARYRTLLRDNGIRPYA